MALQVTFFVFSLFVFILALRVQQSSPGCLNQTGPGARRASPALHSHAAEHPLLRALRSGAASRADVLQPPGGVPGAATASLDAGFAPRSWGAPHNSYY